MARGGGPHDTNLSATQVESNQELGSGYLGGLACLPPGRTGSFGWTFSFIYSVYRGPEKLAIVIRVYNVYIYIYDPAPPGSPPPPPPKGGIRHTYAAM